MEELLQSIDKAALKAVGLSSFTTDVCTADCRPLRQKHACGLLLGFPQVKHQLQQKFTTCKEILHSTKNQTWALEISKAETFSNTTILREECRTRLTTHQNHKKHHQAGQVMERLSLFKLKIIALKDIKGTQPMYPCLLFSVGLFVIAYTLGEPIRVLWNLQRMLKSREKVEFTKLYPYLNMECCVHLFYLFEAFVQRRNLHSALHTHTH